MNFTSICKDKITLTFRCNNFLFLIYSDKSQLERKRVFVEPYVFCPLKLNKNLKPLQEYNNNIQDNEKFTSK